MEWTRIETKWNEMARRLQGAKPGISATIATPVAEAGPPPPGRSSDATAEGATLGTRASA